ncbi:MAG: S26 family signal peptidase [Victivallaceae bacterium]|nr:S26 family signal peptidase [Victivallaceae bacterium]
MNVKGIGKKGFSREELVDIIASTLAKGASARMKALGGSMSPFIKNEDILTVSPLSIATLGVGRVAAFTCSKRKRLTVHRIVKRQSNGCIIKGDNCGRPDGLVPLENILGVITKVERGDRGIGFGMGLERYIIAFMSRFRIIPFVFVFWRIIPFEIRRVIKCVVHS